MPNLPPRSLGPISAPIYNRGIVDRQRPQHLDLGQDYIFRSVVNPLSQSYYAREYAVTLDEVGSRSQILVPFLRRIASVRLLPLSEGSIPVSNDDDYVFGLRNDGLITNQIGGDKPVGLTYGRIGYLLCTDLSVYHMPRAAESTEVNMHL